MPLSYMEKEQEMKLHLIKKYIHPADFEGENIYNIFPIEFNLHEKGRDMEFRVYSLDEGAFMVDNIELGISL